MNDKIKEKWDEAEANNGKSVDIGRLVVCDVCSDDYTDRNETGGFIFGSYAYCPTCAPEHLKQIEGYREEFHIKARCPTDKSFADFVRDYRLANDANFIRITRHPR